MRDVTPAWLNEALHSGGVLSRARLVAFDAEHIGDFSNQLWRVLPRYDRAEPGAPDSLVLKRPRANPRTGHGRPGEGFANEVYFYREIASRTPILVPGLYYGANEGPDGRPILLLQDVSGVLPVNFMRGVEEEHARLATLELARFHAHWWERAEGLRLPHLADPEFRSAIAEGYDSGWHRSRAYFEEAGHSVFVEIGDALVGRVAESIAPRGSPATLLRGDAHFENLALVEGAEGWNRVLFLDWAAARTGHPSFDVAVFAVQSFPTEVRRRTEESFVATHAELCLAAGVKAWPDPWLDYRRGVLYWIVHMLQGAKLRPGDPPWIVIDRYVPAAVDLEIGELIL